MSEDLVVLREILQRELETINAYEKMLDRLSDPALRTIIEHITDEEREHVAEMFHLIMDRDPKQRARSEESRAQLFKLLQTDPALNPENKAMASGEAPAAALPPTVFPENGWSVGGIKARSVARGANTTNSNK